MALTASSADAQGAGARAPCLQRAIGMLVAACARHALWVLAVTALATGAVVYYTSAHLVLNTDTSGMLDPDLAFRKLQRDFNQAFPQMSDNLVVVLDSTSRSAARDAARALATALTRHTALYQGAYLPGASEFFQRNGLLYLDIDDLWKLSDQLTDAQPVLGALARDPSLRGLFELLDKGLSGDLNSAEQDLLGKVYDRISAVVEAQLHGRGKRIWWRDELLADEGDAGKVQRSFLIIRAKLDYASMEFSKGPLETLRELIRAQGLDGSGPVRARVTGSVAMSDDELASVSRSASVATAVSFGLVCVLLFIGMRGAWLAVAVLTTLAVGLAWTAGFATLAVGQLNLISVSFAVLFIGLSVDFGIQFGLAYREALTVHGDTRQALTVAGRDMGSALTLAACAAAVSFFAFTPTHYRGLAELGIIAGGGMFLALAANLTVLPALITVLPAPAAETAARLNIAAPPIGRWRRGILIVATIATVAGLVLLSWVRFDFNPLNMKDPDTESVQAFRDLLADSDTTPYTAEVLTADLSDAKRLAQRLERLPEVDKVVTLASFVPSEQDQKLALLDDLGLALGPALVGGLAGTGQAATVEQEMHAIAAFLATAQAHRTQTLEPRFAASVKRLARALRGLGLADRPRTVVAQLHQRVVNDLPKALTEIDQALSAQAISLDSLPAALVSRYRSADGRFRVEVYPSSNLSDNRALARFGTAVRQVAPNATDSPVSLLEGGRTVIAASVQATALAIGGVTLLLWVALRRIAETALVLVPLLMAIILTGASTVTFHLPLNLGNIIALPLLLGLGVAYGIYVMARRRTGAPLDELYRGRTARAIVFSALTTMASFGTLSFASHRGLATLGQLLVVALVYTLICALMALPALIGELDARRQRPAP